MLLEFLIFIIKFKFSFGFIVCTIEKKSLNTYIIKKIRSPIENIDMQPDLQGEGLDLDSLISRIKLENLSQIVFQCPNDFLPKIFAIKRIILQNFPLISIRILCDKQVFFQIINKNNNIF